MQIKKLIKSFASRFMYLQNNPTLDFVYEFEGEYLDTDEETGMTGAMELEKGILKGRSR